MLRITIASWAAVAVLAGSGWFAVDAAEFPDWAYPQCNRAATDDTQRRQVPGSSAAYSPAEIADWSVTSDWFPREHGEMPAVLARSGNPARPACGFCHLADGSGRPENAKVAGLPAPYIIAQVHDLHSGRRGAAAPDYVPTRLMAQVTTDLSDADLAAAADYFARRPSTSYVRVVESKTVPHFVTGCAVFLPAKGRDAILGARIIEMPVDAGRFELRDPHVPYVAYVPKGSIHRGRVLAETGDNGRTLVCSACHGTGLRGDASLPGPPLAGRFATYLFRQLYGFGAGTRHGESALAMRTVTSQLTQADMIDLAAYAASLPP